jgi:hypothetical protein
MEEAIAFEEDTGLAREVPKYVRTNRRYGS